jgi:hypothetical protein
MDVLIVVMDKVDDYYNSFTFMFARARLLSLGFSLQQLQEPCRKGIVKYFNDTNYYYQQAMNINTMKRFDDAVYWLIEGCLTKIKYGDITVIEDYFAYHAMILHLSLNGVWDRIMQTQSPYR